MAKADDTNGNGIKWLGLTPEKWVSVFQSVGFPTALVAFMLYLAWCYLPPVVQGHVELLQKTGATLESMDRTLQQSNAILAEVNDVEQATKAFMTTVCDDHNKQHDKLDVIIEQTKTQ